MNEINGISLERYADLCAAMNDVIGNPAECEAVAAAEGIAADDWQAAHIGWQARMQDMEDMGRTATQFVPLWQSALERRNGPVSEPCSFEEFARVQNAMSRDLSPDRDAVLASCGIDRETWRSWNGYWAPKLVSDMTLQSRLARIMQQG